MENDVWKRELEEGRLNPMKDVIINLRLTSKLKEQLQYAAELEMRTLTSFILFASVCKAREVLCGSEPLKRDD